MKYLMLVVLGILLFMFACSSEKQAEPQTTVEKTKTVALNVSVDMLTTTKDLACGMELTNESIADTAIYEGQLYGFCSEGCKSKFKADPQAALAKMEKEE